MPDSYPLMRGNDDHVPTYRGVFGNAKTGGDAMGHTFMIDTRTGKRFFESDEQRVKLEQIRRSYDRPLQVARVRPVAPEAGMLESEYERSLLQSLAFASRTHNWDLSPMPMRDLVRVKERIVADVMERPKAENRLEEIKIWDESGRVVSEFCGSMNSWLSAYKAQPMAEGIVDKDEMIGLGPRSKPIRPR